MHDLDANDEEEFLDGPESVSQYAFAQVCIQHGIEPPSEDVVEANFGGLFEEKDFENESSVDQIPSVSSSDGAF